MSQGSQMSRIWGPALRPHSYKTEVKRLSWSLFRETDEIPCLLFIVTTPSKVRSAPLRSGGWDEAFSSKSDVSWGLLALFPSLFSSRNQFIPGVCRLNSLRFWGSGGFLPSYWLSPFPLFLLHVYPCLHLLLANQALKTLPSFPSSFQLRTLPRKNSVVWNLLDFSTPPPPQFLPLPCTAQVAVS